MAATTFSIDSFTAKFPGGGALSSLYQVSAAITTDHNSINSGFANFNFVCKGANLPTSALESTEVIFMGRPIKIPLKRAQQDWNTSIYNDEGMEVRFAVEKWMDMINTHVTNIRTKDRSTINSYTGTLSVTQFKKDGEKAPGTTYTFKKAWPTTIAEVALAWDANEIETYDVTWAYAHWTSQNIKE